MGQRYWVVGGHYSDCRFKDIQPGSAGSYLSYLTNVNGTLFFSADDGSHGSELWRSNGTAASAPYII